MTHARQGQAAALLPDDSVLVVGGDQTGRSATAERFVVQRSALIDGVAVERRA